MPKSLETREKMSEAARRRWEGMDDSSITFLKESVSLGMKKYWAEKTDEERHQRAVKAAATRKANRLAKLQGEKR